MSYSEDIVKLRKRVLDAVSSGVVDPNLKDFYEATLLQIMNEAERNRQTAVAQAETLRKQAAIADGQASAYASMSSVVYNVLNAFIIQHERAQQLESERSAQKLEEQAFVQTVKETQVEPEVKKTKKK